MLLWLLVALAVTATVAAVALAWRVSPAARDRVAHRFARQEDLALPAELAPWLGDRLVRQVRYLVVAVGAAAGLCIAYLALVGGVGTESAGKAWRLVGLIAIVQLSVAAGFIAAQATDHARQPGDRPRSAHLRPPRIDDFVTPLELWWSRGSAAVATLVAGTLAVRGQGAAGLVAIAVGCAGIWLIVEVAARSIARARPVAGDIQSLAFDDALRAQALRRFLPAATNLLLAVAIAGNHRLLLGNLGYALIALYVAGLFAPIWVEASPRAKRHYRRRLWPSPAR